MGKWSPWLSRFGFRIWTNQKGAPLTKKVTSAATKPPPAKAYLGAQESCCHSVLPWESGVEGRPSAHSTNQGTLCRENRRRLPGQVKMRRRINPLSAGGQRKAQQPSSCPSKRCHWRKPNRIRVFLKLRHPQKLGSFT